MTNAQTIAALRALLEAEPEDGEWLWLCLFRALAAPVRDVRRD